MSEGWTRFFKVVTGAVLALAGLCYVEQQMLEALIAEGDARAQAVSDRIALNG